MHRTIRVPRPHAWACLIALLLSAGFLPARAQEQLPPPGGAPGAAEPAIRTEILGINQTRKIGMTSKAPIINVDNENSTVVKIDKVERDPTTIFITGLTRGVTRLVFTDVNKKTEVVVVRTDDTEQRRLELVETIRRIAPTAVVTPTVLPNSTVILTGYINDIETGQRIMEAARAIFTIRGDGQGQQQLIPATVFNGMTIGGVQQVQLEVVVAIVNRSRLRTMNFSFTYADNHTTFNSVLTNPTQFISALTTQRAGGLNGGNVTNNGNLASQPNLSFAFLGNTGAFQSYLQALNTDGLAKILADSRIISLSGQPAVLNSGGETPILQSGGVGQSTVSFKPFGTVVNFLPTVQNGKIFLQVRAELSQINQANGITIAGVTPTVIPGFSTRYAQSAVQLEDGQTLAIGGLIQNTVNATIQRVPILGDIPFLNVFFTSKNYNEIEEEMLILVTPRLVDGVSCDRIPKYLPGRETRSPDDFELFLEGILEAPRGQRWVSSHPMDYRGAHTISPNAGAIPCAPANAHNGHGWLGGAGCGPTGCTPGHGTMGCPTCVPGGNAVSTPTAIPVAVPAAPKTTAVMPVSNGEVPASYTTQPLPMPAPNAVPPIRDLAVPQATPQATPQAMPQAPQGIAVPAVNFAPAQGDER